MTVKMDDWVTIKVKGSLVREIDREIAKEVEYGISRYRSRSDFVKYACLAFLQKERGKGREEEIIVAGK
jgi:Arc/MetJ-type ribon-helix-helix transcriptional regulator